jgi:phosphoribosylpyrophosphate synthetase
MTSVKSQVASGEDLARRTRATAAALLGAIEDACAVVGSADAAIVIVPSSASFVCDCCASAALAGWPCPTVLDVLRAEPRPKQTGLSELGRRDAASGKHYVTGRVDDQAIILVDDMYTSGHTMHDAARALIDAGARAVAGAVYARRIYPDALALYRHIGHD